MRGRVLGRSSNTNKIWVADSGTSVSIILVSISKRNGIKWIALDPDEPNYSSMTTNELTILGQTNIWIKFKHIKKAQEIEALVCEEESDENPIDFDFLQDMEILFIEF